RERHQEEETKETHGTLSVEDPGRQARSRLTCPNPCKRCATWPWRRRAIRLCSIHEDATGTTAGKEEHPATAARGSAIGAEWVPGGREDCRIAATGRGRIRRQDGVRGRADLSPPPGVPARRIRRSPAKYRCRPSVLRGERPAAGNLRACTDFFPII